MSAKAFPVGIQLVAIEFEFCPKTAIPIPSPLKTTSQTRLLAHVLPNPILQPRNTVIEVGNNNRLAFQFPPHFLLALLVLGQGVLQLFHVPVQDTVLLLEAPEGAQVLLEVGQL